jgi:tetratricopeptide (TPR) repeat protein
MKKRFGLFAMLITVLMHTSGAQTPKSDSLREVLKKDTANFDVLIELAKSLVDVDNKQAILWAIETKQIAIRKPDTTDIVRASRVVGQLYNRLGDVEMATKELSPLLAIAERKHLKNEVKMILNSLASAFMLTAQYDKALEYNFKSLVLRETENNKKEISIALNNIGAVYLMTSNYEQALIYLKRCLAVKQEIGDEFDVDKLYLNLGICYGETGNFDEAEVLFAKGINQCGPNCSKEFLMRTEYAIGDCYRMQKKIC